MSAEAPQVGDIVYVENPSYPGPWKITKVNSVTVLTEQEGRRLKAHKSLLLDQPPGIGRPFEPVTYFSEGQIVRWTQAPPKARGSLFVVIADKGAKVNIAVLGGDQGRYWRVGNRRNLEVVPVSELAEALKAAA
jgi:hypothetical protein